MAIAVAIIATGLAGAALWFLANILWKRSGFVDLVNKIPGPKAVPLFGNTLTLKLDRVGESQSPVRPVWR